MENTFVGLISSYRCLFSAPFFVLHAKYFLLLKSRSCLKIVQSLLRGLPNVMYGQFVVTGLHLDATDLDFPTADD